MEAIVQAILRNHPELASWLLSNQYTKGFRPSDLMKAFPTLKFHRTGTAIVEALGANPTAVRRALAAAAGFESGSDMAGLAGAAGKLRGVGSLSPFGAIAGQALPEAIGMLRDDAAARRSVQGHEMRRASNRSLDRELRRTGPSPYEQEIGRVQAAEAARRQVSRPQAPAPPTPEAGMDMYGGMSPYEKNIADVYTQEAARRQLPRPQAPRPPLPEANVDMYEGMSPYAQNIADVYGQEASRRSLPRPEAPLPPTAPEPAAGVPPSEYAKMIARTFALQAGNRQRERPKRPDEPIEVKPIDIAMPLMRAMYPDLDPIDIEMSLEEAMLPELLADELTARQLPDYEFVKRPLDIKVPPVKPLKKRKR